MITSRASPASNPQPYVGLMSGTSVDAIDAVVVDATHTPPHPLACYAHPIPEYLRQRVHALVQGPADLDEMMAVDALFGDLFAEAALQVIRASGLETPAVMGIGSHGQTVRHRPEGDPPATLQVGDPNRIAERTGITTVADFRRRDMAAGGEGAPLVAGFHDLVFRRPDEARVVLNIGGIANLTIVNRDEPLWGYDTGPGNALMDLWAMRHHGGAYDEGGHWAARGRVLPSLLDRMLADPYFQRAPPKSTGREYFDTHWLDQALTEVPRARPMDVQATLAELTAVSITQAIASSVTGIHQLLVCGGGAHNAHLMRRLAAHVPPGCRVATTDSHGVPGDWVEATAFAWLAWRTLTGQTGNIPTVTGATRAVPLGGIYPA